MSPASASRASRPARRAPSGAYTADFNRLTYAELGRRAAQRGDRSRRSARGRDVPSPRRPRRLRRGLRRAPAPLLFVECQAPPETLASRAARASAEPGRVSDASLRGRACERAHVGAARRRSPPEAHVVLRSDRPVEAHTRRPDGAARPAGRALPRPDQRGMTAIRLRCTTSRWSAAGDRTRPARRRRARRRAHHAASVSADMGTSCAARACRASRSHRRRGPAPRGAASEQAGSRASAPTSSMPSEESVMCSSRILRPTLPHALRGTSRSVAPALAAPCSVASVSSQSWRTVMRAASSPIALSLSSTTPGSARCG